MRSLAGAMRSQSCAPATSLLRYPPPNSLRQTVRHMIGAEPGAFFPKEKTAIGMPVLSVRGLSGAGFVEDVSFRRPSRRDPGLLWFGRRRPLGSRANAFRHHQASIEGEIKVDGRAARPRSPAAMRCRLGSHFYLKTATNRGWCCSFRFVRTRLSRSSGNWPTEWASSTDQGEADRSRFHRPDACGGNRCRAADRYTFRAATSRKYCWPNGLIPSPLVLILDQPTRGIDVGAKAEIHRIVSHLAPREWPSSSSATMRRK